MCSLIVDTAFGIKKNGNIAAQLFGQLLWVAIH